MYWLRVLDNDSNVNLQKTNEDINVDPKYFYVLVCMLYIGTLHMWMLMIMLKINMHNYFGCLRPVILNVVENLFVFTKY